MRFVVIGVGAIGGFLGARLATSGHEVFALARGETAAALRLRGLRVEFADGTALDAPVAAVADSASGLRAAGLANKRADCIVIALKAYSIPGLAAEISALSGPNTVVVPAINGVPWWFFQGGFGGPANGLSLPSLDPQGELVASIPAQQILGCVVHMSASLRAPGVVKHNNGQRFLLGNPLAFSGAPPSAAQQAVFDALAASRIDAEMVPDIQRQIWFKLWGNLTANPMSALTRARMDAMLGDPLSRQFMLAMMKEVAQVGAQIGCAIDQSGEERLSLAEKLGPFKTSMLQDLEAGKPLEVDAMLGAFHNIARHLGAATPHVDSLHGLMRVFQANR